MLLWSGSRCVRSSSCVLLRRPGTLGSHFRQEHGWHRPCCVSARLSGGTDEQPPKVRRRLTRVTLGALASSVVPAILDADDNTSSTVAHTTIHHLVPASFSTRCSTSAVLFLAHSGSTSDLPPCPRPVRFRKCLLADADFFEYVDSESLEMVRVHHDYVVLRAVLEEGPSDFGVANFLDEAVSCGIRWGPLVIQSRLGASSALRCQS